MGESIAEELPFLHDSDTPESCNALNEEPDTVVLFPCMVKDRLSKVLTLVSADRIVPVSPDRSVAVHPR